MELAHLHPGFVGVETGSGRCPGMGNLVSTLQPAIPLHRRVFKRFAGEKQFGPPDFKRDFNYRAYDLQVPARWFPQRPAQRDGLRRPTLRCTTRLSQFLMTLHGMTTTGTDWRVRTSHRFRLEAREMAIISGRLSVQKDGRLAPESLGFNMYRIRRYKTKMTALSPSPRLATVTRMGCRLLLENLAATAAAGPISASSLMYWMPTTAPEKPLARMWNRVLR